MQENTVIVNPIKMSIIVPVYNVEPYLKQCLDSIINQDLKEIEIICVNDGSTDKSLEILEEYQKKDSRIIIINQENQGVGTARNKGIEASKGEYLFIVDSDDWLEENKLKNLYLFAKKNNSQVVWFDFRAFEEHKRSVSYGKFPFYLLKKQDKFNNFKDLVSDGFKNNFSILHSAAWHRIFKTDFIKNNNITFPKINYIEDTSFSIVASLLCDKIHYFPQSVYCYRERTGSISHSHNENAIQTFKSLDFLENCLKSHNLFEDYKKQFDDYKMNCAFWGYWAMPDTKKDIYMERAKQYFSEKDFKKLQKCCVEERKRNFFENIFSIRNTKFYTLKYKIVTLFGIPFYFRVKNKNGEKFIPDIRYQILPFDNNNKKAFVFAVDNSSVEDFLVLLKSLIENSAKNKNFDVVLFTDNITEQNKEKLSEIMPSNFNLRFFDMGEIIRKNFYKLNLITKENMQNAIFYKCFIPFVMQNYEKVLYCNGKILINKNIKNVFDINLEDNKTDFCTDVLSVIKNIKTENLKNYFDNGVILFDILKIDINEYFEKFIETI